jgi:NAD-dependent SIR2 family protein deacetylase
VSAVEVDVLVLKNLHGLDGNPEAWHCTRCDKTTPGHDIRISYDVGDTPIPYCPNCPAYGPDLKPAAAGPQRTTE